MSTPSPARRPGIACEDVLTVVRVHLDRAHDLLRRLGCGPAAAAEVLEASALALVDTAARQPREAPDLLGWWFARVRGMGRRAADGAGDLPVGGGLLAVDTDQELISRTLESLPERDRVTLLLQDAYDLPLATVAAALGAREEVALEGLGRARLAFLQALDGDVLPVQAGHAVDMPALARLALPASRVGTSARDAQVRQHAAGCAVCGALLAAQSRAHLLLTGTAVVAPDDAERAAILSTVETRARAALPAASELVLTEDELAEEAELLAPPRLVTPLGVAAGLVLAIAAGIGIGVLLSRDGGVSLTTGGPGPLPAVTADPVPTLPAPSPTPSVSSTATPSPTTTVFLVTPSATPTPSLTASRTPAAPTDTLSISLDPARGPNNATLTVNGQGWLPGTQVTVVYNDSLGRPTDSRAVGLADARGRFTVQLGAVDPTAIPGPHQVVASNGEQTTSAIYEAES